MNYQTKDSLSRVVNVLNESSEALNDTNRTIAKSAIPEVLAGALGAGIGGAGSLAMLSTLGVTGLSAAGITSGLAAAGGLIGGGMAAGVLVLSAPVAVLGFAGVGLASYLKGQQQQDKERLYQEALKKHTAIIKAMKAETYADRERMDF